MGKTRRIGKIGLGGVGELRGIRKVGSWKGVDDKVDWEWLEIRNRTEDGSLL